ncbi:MULTISPECIES: MASE4 domain-containing protein [unclassified Variovorax]|uniref:MASE4 domain-containing protein n=1 Tax=unclassified Variovorax TaxID=663243 RepID=UPI001BD1F388|nr:MULTISPECIES: MASE4 domain-containing protein [unclassified Variovorax]
MPKQVASPPEGGDFIFSGLPPSPAQKRLAGVVVLALLSFFLLVIAGPFSGIQLGRISAFVPAYVMAMFVNDLITSILLFSQFSIVRSRAILVIASGYLFTALIVIAVFLTFPGAIATDALLGGLQSTSWLYFSWHAGFPMFVIGYALTKDADGNKRLWGGTVRGGILLSVALTVAVVVALAVICMAGEPWLPRMRLDSVRLGPQWPYVGVPVSLLSVVAIMVLWTRRRSMLDLWLMVVLCAHAFEVPLTYFPAQIIYGVGWYAGRVFGFLSSILVLIVLLYEITTLYAKLLAAVLAQRREREARRMTGDAVAATIAHEVRQPLSGMITSAEAGLRFLDRAQPDAGKAGDAFRRVVADGHRAAAVLQSIRAIFRNEVRHRTRLDVEALIRKSLALVVGDLQRHQILVHSAPGKSLPEVHGDRIQLQQVLLNLIMNAVDSMSARDEPRVLQVSSEPYEGDGIKVSVADTGAGVGTQDVERIFSPLFTTKPDGMGMGLSICRSIVEAHHGRLWVDPNTPRGAVFQFTLRPGVPAAA